MHPNKNKTAVKRIAKGSLKANLTRNVFAVLAIILTTFMITTIFSIGVSFAKNTSIMYTRLSGTTATIFLDHPSQEQYKLTKESDAPSAVGVEINIGSVAQTTDSGENTKIPMLYYDEIQWKDHYVPAISHIHGSYPVEENEIMLSMSALNQLGITNPTLGMDINLRQKTKLGLEQKTYLLSGWFTSYDIMGGKGIALLSKAYCESNGFSMEENGRLTISAPTGKDNYVSQQLVYNIPLQQGQEFQSKGNIISQDEGIYIWIVIILMALFIVFSGYLLIYNIIYISISKDVRFYGLLKTIGTSPLQIKSLVRSQMYRLSIIGIPTGLLLGAITSFITVPLTLTMFTGSDASSSSMPSDISFHPVIFIGTAAFSLLTIVISCRKPAKMASRVSPIEAMKVTNVIHVKKESRRSTKGGKLYKMAFYNVFRERKRAFLVFASLFMGIITLLSVNSFLESLSVENYISRYIPHDFSYTSTPPLNDDTFSENFMSKLANIKGIDKTSITRGLYSLIQYEDHLMDTMLKGEYNQYASIMGDTSYEDFKSSVISQSSFGAWIYSIDEAHVKEYNKNNKDSIDLEAFRKGELIILGNSSKDDRFVPLLNQSITFTGEEGQESQTVSVAGVFGPDDYEGGLNFHMVGSFEAIYVSEAFFQRFNGNPRVLNINLDVDPDIEPMIRTQLEELNLQLSSSFLYKAKSTESKYFISTMNTMNILSTGISSILILIGILNFINVMLTGVHSRRQELAILESIGMTKVQIRKMLSLEGIYYSIITGVLLLTIGSGILTFIGYLTINIADYAVYQYPVKLILLILAILFLICLIIPNMIYRLAGKESVTERLRLMD